MITCHSVVKEYGRGDLRKRVLDRLDCTIEPRTQLVVLGQRGSGKSTLLQILAGQLIPTRGWVERRARIAPPGGLLRYASWQSSPRQFITLISRLYDVNHRELFNFVTAFSQIGWMIDKPLRVLPSPLRRQFNLALTYGVPFDFYMHDGSAGKGGDSDFRELCLEACDMRRQKAGMILATSNAREAFQMGGDGAIIYQGRLTLYPSLDDAIEAFALLPKVQPTFNVRELEEQDLTLDEEIF